MIISAIAVILCFQAEQPISCTFHHHMLTYLWWSLLQADLNAFHVFYLFFLLDKALFFSSFFNYSVPCMQVAYMHVTA